MIGHLAFRPWEVQDEAPDDQNKTLMKVAADIGEATIGSAAAVEAAMVVEVAETSSAVVEVTAVAVTVLVAAAVVVVVQVG